LYKEKTTSLILMHTWCALLGHNKEGDSYMLLNMVMCIHISKMYTYNVSHFCMMQKGTSWRVKI